MHWLSSCHLWALEGGLSDCDPPGLVALQQVETSGTRDQTMSPALADRFLTTGPQGTYSTVIFEPHKIFTFQ